MRVLHLQVKLESCTGLEAQGPQGRQERGPQKDGTEAKADSTGRAQFALEGCVAGLGLLRSSDRAR